MLQFQPAGFGQKSVSTDLGQMTYYTQIDEPWRQTRSGSKQPDDHRTILFFHNFGGGASAYEWSKVYAALADSYTVIAPDLLGWGTSAHPPRRYTTQDYLDSIAAFVEQISAQQAQKQQAAMPITAVASSFTAGLIARLAAAKPDLFHSLFLTCPAGFKDFGTGAGRRLPAPIINTPFLDKAIYTVGATNEFAVRNFLENFLFAQPNRLSQETVDAYLTSAQQPNAEYAALAFLRGDLYFDLATYLPELTVPTAMVWGGRAQFTPVSIGRRLANLNPKAVRQFRVVSETGVLPHLEQPGVVTAFLLSWLNQDLD
ncbi:MAG: alpha/beta hydrolase [Cyanobacteria bacterium J06632_3]